jgi:D-methionine transport system substrate-binding protein
MARSSGRRKEIAAKDGLDIQVVVFNDYLLPNAALDVGDLDANAFQHKPFLENQIKTRGYKVTSVGETIVAPIGLYSRRAKSVADIGDGASIGIPNDPSNGGRALLLLQAQNLIKSRMALAGCPPSSNCRQSEEVATARNRWGPASAQSGRRPAVINTNYVVSAGLIPGRDCVGIESPVNNPQQFHRCP